MGRSSTNQKANIDLHLPDLIGVTANPEVVQSAMNFNSKTNKGIRKWMFLLSFYRFLSQSLQTATPTQFNNHFRNNASSMHKMLVHFPSRIQCGIHRWEYMWGVTYLLDKQMAQKLTKPSTLPLSGAIEELFMKVHTAYQ